MNLVIVGHTGLIGSNLFRFAVNQGVGCVGISRGWVDWYQPNLGVYKREKGGIESVDIERLLSIEETQVVNCAWVQNPRISRNSFIHREALKFEIDLIEVSSKFNVHYVGLGSISELLSDEEGITSSEYAKSKVDILNYLRGGNGDFAWLRIPSAFGREDRRDWLLPQLLRVKFLSEEIKITNPHATLNLVNAELVSECIMDLLQKKFCGDANISNHRWHSVIDLYDFAINRKPLCSKVVPSGHFGLNDPKTILVSDHRNSSAITEYFDIKL